MQSCWANCTNQAIKTNKNKEVQLVLVVEEAILHIVIVPDVLKASQQQQLG